MHWMEGWHMGWMWFGWLVFLVLIVVLVWAAARSSGAATASRPSPEEFLKERYARGEIERDEYDRRLGDLRK